MDPVSIDNCFAIEETDDALLAVIPKHGQVWIPKSQIDDDSDVYTIPKMGAVRERS
jgi:hypothetical protein